MLSQFHYKCFIFSLLLHFTLDKYSFIHTFDTEDWLRDRL